MHEISDTNANVQPAHQICAHNQIELQKCIRHTINMHTHNKTATQQRTHRTTVDISTSMIYNNYTMNLNATHGLTVKCSRAQLFSSKEFPLYKGCVQTSGYHNDSYHNQLLFAAPLQPSLGSPGKLEKNFCLEASCSLVTKSSIRPIVTKYKYSRFLKSI